MDNNINKLDKYFFIARNEKLNISIADINNIISELKPINNIKIEGTSFINIKYIIMTGTLLTTLAIGILFFNSTKKEVTSNNFIKKPVINDIIFIKDSIIEESEIAENNEENNNKTVNVFFTKKDKQKTQNIVKQKLVVVDSVSNKNEIIDKKIEEFNCKIVKSEKDEDKFIKPETVVKTIQMYDEIWDFDFNNMTWAKVKLDDKYGFIDTNGKEVVPLIYDEVYEFNKFKTDWMLVEQDNKLGFIDTNGKEVVPLIYDEVYEFNEIKEGWMQVKRDGKILFIDTNGKEVFLN